jgi:FkbM family methyltransferase
MLFYLRHRRTFPLSREEFRYLEISFSQNGEDLMVWNTKVFTWMPERFIRSISRTTLLLYKHGWRGTNVDLSESKIKQFRKLRPKDHNVLACLSDGFREVQVAHYSAHDTDRVIPPETSDQRSILGETPLSISSFETVTLDQVINASPFAPAEINYVNIDCEGHDLAVLRGLDLNRCRPRIITIEGWTNEARGVQREYLEEYGYRLSQFLGLTSLFV